MRERVWEAVGFLAVVVVGGVLSVVTDWSWWLCALIAFPVGIAVMVLAGRLDRRRREGLRPEDDRA